MYVPEKKTARKVGIKGTWYVTTKMAQPQTTTLQQQATMGNAASTVCTPIDWSNILKKSDLEFTPISVREYLHKLIEKMNKHIGIWMDGPLMSKLQITRDGKNGAPPISVSISIWRAKQLFPQSVTCNWKTQNGKKKTLFRNVIELFLVATNRNEIYHTPPLAFLKTSPVIEWLKLKLSLPSECCSIKWDGLNARSLIYSSFLECEKYPDQWSAKKISQEFYSILESSRPGKNKRIRHKGISMMYLPSRDQCRQVLEQWKVKYESNDRLRF